MRKFWRSEVFWISVAVIATIPAIAVNRTATYDFDGDGKVSFDDINRYCDVPKILFDNADKDHDTFLSESEMRAAKEYLFTNCADKHASYKSNK
jgi:hypothetical protein